MPKPEETHKTHKEPKPQKPPKRKVRHPLLAKVGAGLLSAGLLFSPMGKTRADDAPQNALPEYVPPQTQYTPVPQSLVESEFIPLAESSRQYIRDMEDNKPTRWEVKVSGWQPSLEEDGIAILEVSALLPNGRKVRMDIANADLDKLTILEISNPQFGDHTVLALIDSHGTTFYYKDPQTGEFRDKYRGHPGKMVARLGKPLMPLLQPHERKGQLLYRPLENQGAQLKGRLRREGAHRPLVVRVVGNNPRPEAVFMCRLDISVLELPLRLCPEALPVLCPVLRGADFKQSSFIKAGYIRPG